MELKVNKNRKKIVGVVVKNKMDKTVVVEVSRVPEAFRCIISTSAQKRDTKPMTRKTSVQ